MPEFVSDREKQTIRNVANTMQPQLEQLDNHIQNFKRYFGLLRNLTNYTHHV